MKNYSHEEALKIILLAAKQYQDLFENKDFMIIYKEKEIIKYKLIGFSKGNFCHLTGADIKNARVKTTATEFYKLCLDGKLSKDNFPSPKGNMNLKLAVLPYLSKLFFNHCSIGDFINNGVQIRADYFIGNTKNILSVGFRKDKKTIYDYPVTLYNQSIKQLTEPVLKVEAIFRKEKDDEYFSEYTYCNKNFNIEILSNCEFSSMIKCIHYYKDEISEKSNSQEVNSQKEEIYQQVNSSQMNDLANNGIPFKAKKISDDSFIVVFEKKYNDKVNQILSQNSRGSLKHKL